MTWSQAVFGYCGAVLSATSAVLSGLKAGKRGKSILLGGICGGGLVFATVAVMAVAAAALFPGYPVTPVPELIGVLLTLPCVIAGICALRFIGGWKTCSKQAVRRSCLIIAATWVAGVLLSYELVAWRYRKALPWTASEIREYAWRDGFLPDFTYFLRAGITETQFDEYVARFKLTTSEEMGLSYDDRASWFRPPPGEHKVYGLTDGRWSMSAIYDAGHIYVRVTLQ